MKLSRIVVAVLVLVAAGSWAVSHACDKSKGASARAASHATCTAAMAQGCTAAQAAQCGSKGAAASASAGECAAHGASAVDAVMGGGCPQGASASECPFVNGRCVKSGQGVSAVSAGMTGCSEHKTSAAAAGMTDCSAHATSATAAGMAGCSAHKTSAAAAGMNGCSAHAAGATKGGCSGTSMNAAAGWTGCGSKATSAMANGAGGCPSHAATASGAKDGCDACGEMVSCQSELGAAGASAQIVPLKNGVMVVYTADSPARVRAVQAALTRRNDRIKTLTAAGDKAHLCDDCKALRGAAASGKLQREVINIEGGCLTLVTSNDPAVLARIYAAAGVSAPVRAGIKS